MPAHELLGEAAQTGERGILPLDWYTKILGAGGRHLAIIFVQAARLGQDFNLGLMPGLSSDDPGSDR